MPSLINLDALVRPLAPSSFTAMDAPQTPKQARRIARRVNARRFARLQQRQAAVDALRPLPVPGESLHGASDGSFSGWMLAAAIIDLLACPVDQLTVATLGFNRENCRDLCDAIDAGRVRSCLLLVSDYFRSSDRKIFAHCRNELERRGQRVAVARSHAKLMLFQAGDRSIVVETSANLRSSMNWEQFVVSDDAALLQFHAGWINDLLEGNA